MKPIDLYIVPPSPPCRAVIIAAKYMKINVNLIYVDLMKGEQKEDWFVKMNPQHCLPTINDNGFILWESRAIMTYFANCYAPDNPIYPSELELRAIVDRLLQFDLNVLYRSLGEFLIPVVREGKKLSNLNPVKERKVVEALKYLDSLLAVNQFVACDQLSLADFSIYYSLEFANELQYSFARFQNVCRWFQQLRQQIVNIENESANDSNGNEQVINDDNAGNNNSESSSNSGGQPQPQQQQSQNNGNDDRHRKASTGYNHYQIGT